MQAIRSWLADHPAVAWVSYPGLADHPWHGRARHYLRHGFGAVLCFGIRGGRAQGGRQLVGIVGTIEDDLSPLGLDDLAACREPTDLHGTLEGPVVHVEPPAGDAPVAGSEAKTGAIPAPLEVVAGRATPPPT